jgi:pyruvate formate-lyase activating enzyme-like uncharacterized protein
VDKMFPPGCEVCLRGRKLVLFVTGICDRSCYYCPLSESRKGLDVVYADEVLVKNDLDIILEARAIDAEGTGITGGDPILKLGRTLRYIKLLKSFFGKEHHIHLYTNGRHVNREVLSRLRDAGLDELRFHPERGDWEKMEIAKELGIFSGAEVPAIPGDEKSIKEFIMFLDKIKADFLNINQLEFCPQNAYQLKQRGFTLDSESMAAVLKSKESALATIDWAEKEGVGIPIHYCSSVVKDAVQTKKRLIKRGDNVARPYEKVSEEGLLSKLIVSSECGSLREMKALLAKKLRLPPYMIGVSSDGKVVEAPEELILEIKRALPGSKISYIEEYPTATRERFTEYPC